MIGKRFYLITMVVLFTMESVAPSIHAKSSSASEYQLKAVFLYNFAKFVEWPSESFADARAPIILGILGKDPFGTTIDQIIKSKTVKDRKLTIKRFEKIKDLRASFAGKREKGAACHILFISSSEEEYLAKILEILKASSVLTVGEMEKFTQRGGMIIFTVKENKIRFEINLDAAKRAELKISSKLLKLAKIVRDERSKDKH